MRLKEDVTHLVYLAVKVDALADVDMDVKLVAEEAVNHRVPLIVKVPAEMITLAIHVNQIVRDVLDNVKILVQVVVRIVQIMHRLLTNS